MRIGIGIDTGGTYTDVVVYEFGEKRILSSAKALTTKEDLSLGILEALDRLPTDLVKKAQLVSLSSTLATNACVEDKGGNAKLIFFGGDKKVIDELGGQYGLPSSEEMHLQESFTNFLGETEREPDWEHYRQSLDEGYRYLDGVGIVEMNAMRNGAVVEKKAKELFQQKYDIPVVCGHELFSELNCLQRSASTLLNAQLFPIIKEFLDAMKTAMEKRGIHAELVIVRSDGSLMSEAFAAVCPVETILCGPAASVIGGRHLSDQANSIIVDMGGTTTDIALIKDHVPAAAADGVTIGKWKTFVNGLYVKTVGLGGDSAVHYDDKGLFLEAYRIVPVCVAAEKYPSLTENLRRLAGRKVKHTKYLHEHYILVRDISDNPRYDAFEKAFCAALKAGPMSLRDAPAAVKKDMYNINVRRLLKDGVVQMCGLTPTDIMHIRGDFSQYSAEASLLAAEFVAFNLGISVAELCGQVYDAVKRKLYINIATVLLDHQYPDYMKKGVSDDVLRFINENYEMARDSRRGGLLSMAFHTDFALVGIGAPIKLFLYDVAKMLGTEAVISEHYEVANALGAIVGNVYAKHVIEIRPNWDAEGISGYTVYGDHGSRVFEALEDAEQFAASEAKHGAKTEARKMGAKGNIALTCNLDIKEAQAKDCMVHLGTSVVAHAVGTIGFEQGEMKP